MGAERDEPVLVVGAGPTGLACALELARLGVPARIVDKAPAPASFSRAIGVNPRTLELLEPAGVTERLLAAGLRLRGAAFHRRDGRVARLRFDAAATRHPFMLSLPQSETERLLAEALAERGVAVERGVELTGLAEDGGRVVASLRRSDGEERAAAAWLVGADGARSSVRGALQIGFPGAPYEHDWRLADARLDWPHARDELHLFLGAEAILLAIPLPGGLTRLVSNGGDPVERLPPEARLDDTLWRSDFRISHRLAAQYRKGRAFLAGDAAHIHSPAGARGMNLGIEDATMLARMLAAGTPERYEGERRPLAARVIREVDLQTRLAAARHPLWRFVRDRVVFRLLALDAVQRRQARRILALD